MNPEEPSTTPSTTSDFPSSSSSIWILPSPQGSDQLSPPTLPPALAHYRERNEGALTETGTETGTGEEQETGSSMVAVAGSTVTSESELDAMILPDEQMEDEGVVYPTPATYGPEYWEKRRQLWLTGQLYPPEPSSASANHRKKYHPLPLISPQALQEPQTFSSQYQNLSQKARGKLPSFLVNVLPSPSPSISSNNSGSSITTSGPITPTNPSSLAQSRATPTPMSYNTYQTARSSPFSSGGRPARGGDDPIDRLEALLEEPGAEETERVWKQGGLEAVSKFLIDGKVLKRGIRLGLVVSRHATWTAHGDIDPGLLMHDLSIDQNFESGMDKGWDLACIIHSERRRSSSSGITPERSIFRQSSSQRGTTPARRRQYQYADLKTYGDVDQGEGLYINSLQNTDMVVQGFYQTHAFSNPPSVAESIG